MGRGAVQNVDIVTNLVRANLRLKNLSSRTEPTTASLRVANFFGPDWRWRDYLFDYQLADLAFCRQVDWLVPRIIKKTSDLTPVIGIDNSSKRVQSFVSGEARTGREAAVVAFGYGNREAGARKVTFPWLDCQNFNSIYIQPSCHRTSTCRQNCLRIQPLESQEPQLLVYSVVIEVLRFQRPGGVHKVPPAKRFLQA